MTRYGETQKAHNHSVFRWTRTDGAVMYDVKVLTSPERQTGQDRCYLKLMPTQRTYTNGIELVIPQDFTGPVFYLRVQGLDMEGNPVGKPSPIEKVFMIPTHLCRKPEPLSAYNEGNGTVLLYPVYDWIPIPGAFQYEVEILDDTPENPMVRLRRSTVSIPILHCTGSNTTTNRGMATTRFIGVSGPSRKMAAP